MLNLRHSTAVLALAAVCLLASAAAQSNRVINCDGSGVQRLSCETGVIKVETAFYGRKDKTTCSKDRSPWQLTNTNCALKEAQDLVKKRCNGKKVCELDTQTVCIRDPCRGTFKYLETTYTCVPAIHLIVCEYSTAVLQCDEGQVIAVDAADYGRRDQTTCSFQRPYRAIKDTNCYGSTNKVAESCNNKNNCTVSAVNSVFGDPCYGTIKYLEVAYNCVFPTY